MKENINKGLLVYLFDVISCNYLTFFNRIHQIIIFGQRL
jgi:hypothetical protein